MTKKQLNELKKVQQLCADYYDPKKELTRSVIIQDIWRTVNFLVHDEEKKIKK
jgi:hypothetical protein